MRAFITGADGFVGRWLSRHLEVCGDEVIAGTEAQGFALTQPDRVREAIVRAQPDAVYHLAAQSLVGESWKHPADTFEVNAMGSLHVLDAALACEVPPRVLLLSSSDVYGLVADESMPVKESQPLAPVSPFAASKVAAEFLGLQAFLGTKLPVIIARGFAHLGPDQPAHFVAPSLAMRIVAASRTAATQLPIGNLEARRDYLDVRDAVRAYRLLVERGVAGEIYNVCSGKEVSIRQLANSLLDAANIDLDLTVDPSLVRARDLTAISGDHTRLSETTGWKPEIKLDQTLRDVLRYWQDVANS